MEVKNKTDIDKSLEFFEKILQTCWQVYVEEHLSKMPEKKSFETGQHVMIYKDMISKEMFYLAENLKKEYTI